jgi:hypothetical protein
MSLRSRARALQRATGLSYQQALERIRSLGAAPAELARKKGWPLKVCDAFLLAPRASVRVEPTARARTLHGLCEELLVTSSARAVIVVDQNGRWLARAGMSGIEDMVWLFAILRRPPPSQPEKASVSFVPDMAEGVHVLQWPLSAGRLVVVFDEQSSLGLVQLRVRAAVREIERLLGDPPMPLPGSGGDSGNGAPAQVSAYDGIFDRLGKRGSA